MPNRCFSFYYMFQGRVVVVVVVVVFE